MVNTLIILFIILVAWTACYAGVTYGRQHGPKELVLTQYVHELDMELLTGNGFKAIRDDIISTVVYCPVPRYDINGANVGVIHLYLVKEKAMA